MISTQVDRLAGFLGADLAQAIAALPGNTALIAVDGAIPITADQVYQVSKGSALAGTVAAPGAGNIGRVIDIISLGAFAHVVTFTGGTLRGGVAGVTTATYAAQIGARLRVRALSATVWQVENNIGVTIT